MAAVLADTEVHMQAGAEHACEGRGYGPEAEQNGLACLRTKHNWGRMTPQMTNSPQSMWQVQELHSQRAAAPGCTRVSAGQVGALGEQARVGGTSPQAAAAQ